MEKPGLEQGVWCPGHRDRSHRMGSWGAAQQQSAPGADLGKETLLTARFLRFTDRLANCHITHTSSFFFAQAVLLYEVCRAEIILKEKTLLCTVI